MKMKTILIASIIFLLIFLIYLTTLDRKVYYLALGDSLAMGQTPYGNIDYGYSDYVKDYLKKEKILEKYVNEFNNETYRTTDLNNDIKSNKKIIINNNPQTIKNALIKADLVTLSIGLNDLLYKLGINNVGYENMHNYIDEMMIDMDDLLSLIKKYCKEDIIIIGYYTPPLYLENEEIKKYIEYANNKLKILSNNYNMHFIDIDKLMDNNPKFLPNSKNIHPSKVGYEAISKEIIKKINETLLKS